MGEWYAENAQASRWLGLLSWRSFFMADGTRCVEEWNGREWVVLQRARFTPSRWLGESDEQPS